MHFFKRNLLYPDRKKDYDSKKIDQIFAAYHQYLLSIKKELSEAAWRLASLSFHDARVVSVTQRTKREMAITLDGGYWGCGYDFIEKRLLDGRITTLSFNGVQKLWVPATIVGDYWLYEEMALSDLAAFDYQVLLWKDEIRIQANEVQIETTDKL